MVDIKECAAMKTIKYKVKKRKRHVTKAEKVVDISLNKLDNDLTLKFQLEAKEVIKNCSTTVNKSNKYKYAQMNFQTTELRALIQLHEENQPICPVVNYINAPKNEVAKLSTGWLKQL
jgi:hypothetical protein